MLVGRLIAAPANWRTRAREATLESILLLLVVVLVALRLGMRKRAIFVSERHTTSSLVLIRRVVRTHVPLALVFRPF